jgi:hypothetical protein
MEILKKAMKRRAMVGCCLLIPICKGGLELNSAGRERREKRGMRIISVTPLLLLFRLLWRQGSNRAEENLRVCIFFDTAS